MGSRRICTPSRRRALLRSSRYSQQRNRVTSRHGVNLSFARVTASRTGLAQRLSCGEHESGRSNSVCQVKLSHRLSSISAPHLPFGATSKAISICASSPICKPVNHEACRHRPLIDRPVPFSSCVQSRNLPFAGLKKLSPVCAFDAALLH